MICPHCGSEIPDHLSSCMICGGKIDPAVNKKKKTFIQKVPAVNKTESAEGHGKVSEFRVTDSDGSQDQQKPSRPGVPLAAIIIGIVAVIVILLFGKPQPTPSPGPYSEEGTAAGNTSEQTGSSDDQTGQAATSDDQSGQVSSSDDHSEQAASSDGHSEQAASSDGKTGQTAELEVVSDEENPSDPDTQPADPAEDAAARERSLRAVLTETIGSDDNIADFCISDYDRDGKSEAFALVGETVDYGFVGNLYYVTEDSVETVLSEAALYNYSEQNHMLRFKECDFYLVGEYFTTGDLTYIFGVKEGEWYEHEFSRRGMSLHQEEPGGDMTAILSDFDGVYDNSMQMYLAHTWKPYYFYWDGDFKEYGGIAISVDDLLTCSGAQQYIDMIQNQGFQIDDIYYRANGIININYSAEEDNSIRFDNMTLIRSGNSVTVKQISQDSGDLFSYSYGGIYHPALAEDIATYPDSF